MYYGCTCAAGLQLKFANELLNCFQSLPDEHGAYVWKAMAGMIDFAKRQCYGIGRKIITPKPGAMQLLTDTVLHASVRLVIECYMVQNKMSVLSTCFETLVYLESWTSALMELVSKILSTYPYPHLKYLQKRYGTL
jgi:hypothetical protein